jgi:hypothetical protein
MSQITLDPALRAKLNGWAEPLEICDASGKLVGQFLPAAVYEKLVYRLAEAQCPYGSAELAQMRQQSGGQPLTDLWEMLGQP